MVRSERTLCLYLKQREQDSTIRSHSVLHIFTLNSSFLPPTVHSTPNSFLGLYLSFWPFLTGTFVSYWFNFYRNIVILPVSHAFLHHRLALVCSFFLPVPLCYIWIISQIFTSGSLFHLSLLFGLTFISLSFSSTFRIFYGSCLLLVEFGLFSRLIGELIWFCLNSFYRI